MIDEGQTARARRHRIVMAIGACAGAAIFAYLAVFQRFIHGRPYGPKWWTNLILGVVVFALAGALGTILVYLGVRRERSATHE